MSTAIAICNVRQLPVATPQITRATEPASYMPRSQLLLQRDAHEDHEKRIDGWQWQDMEGKRKGNKREMPLVTCLHSTNLILF